MILVHAVILRRDEQHPDADTDRRRAPNTVLL